MDRNGTNTARGLAIDGTGAFGARRRSGAALALATAVAAGALAEGAAATMTGYTVVATNVTNSGQNLVRYEVFANFNGPTDTVLYCYNFALVASQDADGYGGFWHKDNSDYNGGVLSTQWGTWAPQLTGSATLNRPFDSFLLIGGTPNGTNSTVADGSWASGGSGSHAGGGGAGWNRPDLVNNGVIGWYYSSASTYQGRVGVSPNTATQVKLGQFVLSQGHGTRVLSLRTAYNSGVSGAPVVNYDGGFTIDPCSISFYRDLDGDGFGSASSGITQGCTAPSGYVANNTDCDDNNAAINPNTIWNRDFDGDGFGTAANGTLTQCAQPAGYVLNNTDCNDNNAAINPNTIWNRDLDGDGFGVVADGTLTQCTQPTGYVLNNTDNCPAIANPTQADCDGDGIGDACDAGGTADCNANGTPDACEIYSNTLRDCDGDLVPDICEGAVVVSLTSPLAPISGTQPMNYTFGSLPRAYGIQPKLRIEATADLGGATDGILVSIDGGAPVAYFGATGTDCPASPDVANVTWTLPAFNALVADGALAVQITTFGAVNSAGCTTGGIRLKLEYDGLPTASDCNNNGLLDSCELGSGAQPDCNANGKPDSCDIAAGTSLDCNANGKPDSCDITAGTSTDLNGNSIPDECSGEFIVGGSGYANIQAAINAAPDGATIRVSAGSYPPVVLSGRQLTLKSLTGAATTFIDGGGESRCVNMIAPGLGASLIEGFTLRNGRAGNGGAVNVVGAALEIRSCVLRDNVATNVGGAVAALDAAVSIVDSEIRSNGAPRGGAVHAEADSASVFVVIDGCLLTGNTASGVGGAMSNAGFLRVVDSVVEANVAGPLGGGLWTQPGSVSELDGAKFCRNAPVNLTGPYVDLGGNVFSQDCDADGVCDADEIASGAENDCNANGLNDSCELTSGADFDCNENGVLDSCDIATGTSTDVDSNLVPDDCQSDCDGDGLPDSWELSQGLALDCDGDAIPDNCEIAQDPSTDKNANGSLDACELARGDLNLDGVINAADLAVMLAFWGVPNPPVGDLDGNGVINGADLAGLLVNWGTTP